MVDRLKDLKKAKASAGSDDEDNEMDLRAGRDENEDEGDAEDLDDFFQDVEKMKGWMADIRSNVDRIKKNYSDLLAEAESERSKKLRDELTDLRNETNTTAQKMRNELKRMRTDNDAFLQKHQNDPSLCKIRTNMHGTLVRTFFDLMQEYQAILSKHDAKMREKAYRQVKLVAPDADEDQINDVLDQGGDVTEQIFAKHIIEDRKRQNAQQTLEYLQEKHNDILDLEKAISELQQLFLDMSILVEAQGDLIDQIQFSVANTKAYHEKAERTLAQVEKTKTKIRKKKVIIFIIIVITVIIIIGAIAAVVGIVIGILTKK